MAEKTLAEEIITIVQSVANDNPAPQRCTILKTYTNTDYVDIETYNMILEQVECAGNPNVGDKGLLVFPNGDENKPFVATFNGNGGSGGGFGVFNINDNGHLIYKTTGTGNPYEIKQDGHLYYKVE